MMRISNLKEKCDMEKINKDQEIARLTRVLLDLKSEKKTYNGAINETIKDLESQIKTLCRDEEI
jgi:hypothetical protein